MSERQIGRILCALMLLAGLAYGQSVSSNIVGTVTDPGDAAVPNVQIQIKNASTGEIRTATSNAEGIFRFPTVPPGTYTLTMKAQTGFKTYVQENLNLASSENRDLGRIPLQLGSLTEEVSVTAVATPVQTASSEKSSLVDGNQLTQIALKGRDLFGYLQLIPGVTGTTGGETTGTGLPGTINGGGTKLFQVDGVVDMDTGSNGTVHYEPNIDSIAEIRVLTSNYQAEFGHNASGVISVVTKGGGQQFHGSAWGTKRHEMFNAQNFFDNIQKNQKPKYRYFVGGFSIGGPIYIPKLFNTDKKRFFFFVSQEYTKQRPTSGTNYYKVATPAERAGDYSATIDPSTNKTYPMYDPITRVPLTATQMTNIGQFTRDPTSAQWGQTMEGFFPLPNRCDLNNNAAGCWNDLDPTQKYKRNYRYDYAGKYPRRNDMIRIDTNLTSKLTGWWRYVNDYDFQVTSFGIPLFTPSLSSSCKGLAASARTAHPECWTAYSEDHPNPGHGHGVGITYTITPSMVNEFTFGKSYNTWDWYPTYPDQMDRALMGNPPHYFDEKSGGFAQDGALARPGLTPGNQNYAFWIPNVTGGWQGSPGSGRPYTNWNDIYSFNDSISWIKGTHSFKAGFYYERTGKVQQGGTGNYLGQYNFSTGGPYDVGVGEANMYLGHLNSYNEGTRIIGDFWYTGIESFIQDNWRISKRLTLDIGVRFYWLNPQENLNHTSALFMMSAYNRSKAGRLYVNGCTIAVPTSGPCPTANQVALDPLTKATTFSSLVGTFVPGSGDYFNGNVVAGTNGVPLTLFTVTKMAPAPRIGLAWDVFGNGKTAIRTGFGQSFNRGDGNQIMGPYAGNPPVSYNRQVYYTTIAAVPGQKDTAGITPIGNSGLYGKQKYEDSMTASFGVQQNMGFGTVIEASWVGQFRRHVNQGLAINETPMFSAYDPANMNPWSEATVTPKRAWSDNFYRPLPGIGGVSFNSFRGTNNYHSLQVSVRRAMTHGVSYGLAYTFAKSMSPGTWGAYDNDPTYGQFFKTRRSASSFSGAPHVLVFNYVYQVPNLGKRLNVKALGWVTDNWTISGITQMQGPFYNSAVGNANFSGTTKSNPAPEYTGGAEGARTIVLRNATVPKDQVTWSYTDWTKNNTFDYQAFAYPMPCSWTPAARATDGIGQSIACFGNAGAGPNYKIPLTYNNWDMTFQKAIPLKSERRELTFRAEMYNIWNHTQFSGLDASPQYNLPNWQNGILVQTNNTLGRFNAARTARRMAMSLRLQF